MSVHWDDGLLFMTLCLIILSLHLIKAPKQALVLNDIKNEIANVCLFFYLN